MKIIFDSEEQKKEVMYWLVNHLCPSEILLKDIRDDAEFYCKNNCKECWAKCGLELEVKENVQESEM